MAINYTQLATEINTDPGGLGYAPLVALGNDEGVASLLNLRRAGIQIKRDDITSKEIIEALALADLPALPTNPNNGQLSTERRQLSYLEMLTNIPTVRLLNDDGTDAPVIANLGGIFPVGTESRNRLLALRTRAGSRAEELFGRNTVVSSADVARALRG